ncbi:activity-regulated cytoskeleton-associated protein-like [Drosophila elegans]|uniref:activity-regulated cytoskeleton-associated protein-like n=1 Tax=Drosophila elegans TaxID=30023 RepID=UPI001BC8308A|nr:activity-regulated cytoskeleton-associated protein-like [Drosophila elegans]XP_041566665.1 activity-regulated cytoskeleton-associated protein-like [Drosophila elegans]XP_041566666.1 activity-regulated cytoskeleton-associated protein-like [Drosophila elegans]
MAPEQVKVVAKRKTPVQSYVDVGVPSNKGGSDRVRKGVRIRRNRKSGGAKTICLSAFARNPNHTETIRRRLRELAEKHKKEKGATDQSSTPAEELNTIANQIGLLVKQINTPPGQESETSDLPDRKEQKVEVEILNRVRSWGMRYQGTTNPLEFLSKMEEWVKGYGIHKDALIQTMSFILEGVAVDWWNTTPSQIRTWEDLREELLEYILPPRYQEQLETQITQLRQRETELTREYAMNLRKLMRFTEYLEETKLDRIYRNCRSKIKLYTRRSGFKTEFLRLAEEVEEIETMEGTNRPITTGNQNLTSEICMRCGGTGHAARTCTNPPRLFCWVCGRNGTRTTDCCRAGAENARGLSR